MEINLIDKSNMRKTILGFPQQFRTGIEAAKNVKVAGRPDKVLICGMGGSALPGDILKMWLEASKNALPLYIWKNYSLPHFIDKNFLVICVSYSGNTEEVLSSFQEAQRRGLLLAAITSGGKLAEFCRKSKIPLVVVPGNFQPRMTLGYQFSALMKILVNCGIIKNSLGNVLTLERELKPWLLENQGKILVKKLKNKIPIIYASDRLKALAQVWKIKFNENSKVPAFSNYFPELNHNEIVGYTKIPNSRSLISNFYVLILRDLAGNSRILKRLELTAKILKNKGVGLCFIEIKGKNILHKIFSNILLADWVSYYLALENKIDPTPVKIIEEFKKKIAEK